MQLTSILSLDCTKSAVLCSSKKRVLELISELAAEKLEQNPQKLFEALLNREKMGSTGIGNGIAIPHGRITGTNQAIGVLIQCAEPIRYNSVDNQPVDLIFALLVPEDLREEHLTTLTFIAEKLSDKQKCRKLRNVQSNQELYQLMTEETHRCFDAVENC